MNDTKQADGGAVLSSAGLGAGAEARKRVRAVEYEPGWGWIARGPDGKEVLADFRWRTRSAARDVATNARDLAAPNVMSTTPSTTPPVA